MNKAEHMRLAISEHASNAELTELFDILDGQSVDQIKAGEFAYRIFHGAVEAFHQERAEHESEQKSRDSKVDDEIDRILQERIEQ